MTRPAWLYSISQRALRHSGPAGAELTVVLKPGAPKSKEKVKFPRYFQDNVNINSDTDDRLHR